MPSLIYTLEISKNVDFFCRNLGIGLCSSIARVGGIVAPLILLIVSGKN